MIWKPNVVVAAVIERDGRFLMVEEEADGSVVINQPAGHLEPDESLPAAVAREVLEETAWHFKPEAVVGVYLYPSRSGVTYLRVCFTGECADFQEGQALDDGVIQTHWLSRDQLQAREPQLRSPLVLRCVDDYRRGRHFPLDLLAHVVEQAA
jgi:8-oxo-dGTP pyrophosphatase MutT (NUDIX family)